MYFIYTALLYICKNTVIIAGLQQLLDYLKCFRSHTSHIQKTKLCWNLNLLRFALSLTRSLKYKQASFNFECEHFKENVSAFEVFRNEIQSCKYLNCVRLLWKLQEEMFLNSFTLCNVIT